MYDRTISHPKVECHILRQVHKAVRLEGVRYIYAKFSRRMDGRRSHRAVSDKIKSLGLRGKVYNVTESVTPLVAGEPAQMTGVEDIQIPTLPEAITAEGALGSEAEILAHPLGEWGCEADEAEPAEVKAETIRGATNHLRAELVKSSTGRVILELLE